MLQKMRLKCLCHLERRDNQTSLWGHKSIYIHTIPITCTYNTNVNQLLVHPILTLSSRTTTSLDEVPNIHTKSNSTYNTNSYFHESRRIFSKTPSHRSTPLRSTPFFASRASSFYFRYSRAPPPRTLVWEENPPVVILAPIR